MHSIRKLIGLTCILAASSFAPAIAQNGTNGTAARNVEIQPAKPDIEVGQKIQFSVAAKDEKGQSVTEKASTWFAAPFDLAKADDNGNVTFFQPGEVLVGAIVGGKPVFTEVVVKPAALKTLDIQRPSSPLIVGGTMKLDATTRVASGDPRTDVPITWSSQNPSIAAVDAAGVVIGLAPGKATLKATANAVSNTVEVNVVVAVLDGDGTGATAPAKEEVKVSRRPLGSS